MKAFIYCTLLASLATAASAQPAAKPPVVALISAVGDRIEIVRQRVGTGSSMEPFTRKTMAINGQSLNLSVLRGLNRAIAEEEPQAQRVPLLWTPPPELAEKLAKAEGNEREAMVIAALKQYLAPLPQRSDWDRIEAIVPSYFYSEMKGMGRKLSGVGFYVQPVQSATFSIDQEGEITDAVSGDRNMSGPSDGDSTTVDPITGRTGNSNTFIAPYMYFQRVTLDARTLEVTARKRQFDSVKYSDPNATGLDVSDQMPLSLLTGKLLEVAERSAYTSVRGRKDEVKVSAPKELPASAPAR